MLLTLVTRSLLSQICSAGDGDEKLTMMDVPDYAIRQLQLRGMNVPASMLSGWSFEDLDRLRDRADKAGCPCLVLVEDEPLLLGSDDVDEREAAADRVARLALAAHRLGCNAVSITCGGPDDEDTFDRVAEEVRAIMPQIERLELNILIAPSAGLTHDPDRLTDLIKRIGGFRIGSLPSFGHAGETGDPIGTLRKLAPYAGAVHATVCGFTPAGKHRGGYDLAACVEAIRSVGFVNTLAIDYVATGKDAGDPVEQIERARTVLQDAIDAES